MRKFFTILIGKTINNLMKIFKFNSTVYPGYISLKLFPNLLKVIEYPKLVIMVTGSSGKGSTTKLITNILRENGYSVTYNDSGSNLLNAFATMIIKDCDFKGKLKTDVLCYEVDERYLKFITKYISPNYLIVNNITRDQPPRQGDFDIVFNEIKKALNKNIHLIVNGDDPITKRFSLYHKGKISYFGIEKNFFSTNNELNYIKDNLYCPSCGNKLNFDYYHYSSVGSYNCPSCDFKRDNINYDITNIDKENMKITINNKYNINISNYILFNLYNICACFSVLDLIKIDPKKITKSLDKVTLDDKIFYKMKANKRNYEIINCKAENNATYNLALLYLSIDKNVKTVVLGLNEISRRYNHYDISWLYDISFDLLKDKSVDKIICAGPYRYDIATRIKYEEINENKIIILENLDNIKETIETKTKGTIYGVLNFDYVDPFIKNIKGVK